MHACQTVLEFYSLSCVYLLFLVIGSWENPPGSKWKQFASMPAYVVGPASAHRRKEVAKILEDTLTNYTNRNTLVMLIM